MPLSVFLCPSPEGQARSETGFVWLGVGGWGARMVALVAWDSWRCLHGPKGYAWMSPKLVQVTESHKIFLGHSPKGLEKLTVVHVWQLNWDVACPGELCWFWVRAGRVFSQKHRLRIRKQTRWHEVGPESR